ncbi:MAG: M28 family peptidase [Candidatus Thorarchaeota archaeon]
MKCRSAVFILSILILLLATPSIQVNGSQARNEESSFVRSSVVNATDLASEIYNAVSESSYLNFIKKLTENGSRVTGSPENVLARNWLVSELANVSRDLVDVDLYGPSNNIIGKLPGTAGDSGPCIVIGGHYDSVAGAPGANDDGSGVAATLELARVLSQYTWQIDIYFCFWNAEENGLIGSRESAPMFVEEERDILVYYNIDMILVPHPDTPEDFKLEMRYLNGTGGIFHDAQYWAEITDVMSTNLDAPFIRPIPMNQFESGSAWRTSDQFAFDEVGYKSLLWVNENGFSIDTAYHDSTDVWDNEMYNYTLATKTVAALGASIAYSIGRTPGQRTHSVYNLHLEPGTSKSRLIEVSMLSELQINGSWDSADGLTFNLMDNSSLELHSVVLGPSSYDSVLLIQTTPEQFGIHELSISNTGSSAVDLEVVITQDIDIEGNGVPDSEDTWYNGFNTDWDGDLFLDYEEEFFGLDRFDADQNNNGVPDLNDDFDGDGLSNADEVRVYKTSPFLADTDGDTIPDGYEVEVGLNPFTRDGFNDPDSDGLESRYEYQYGTDPFSADSDSDSMPDGWEIDNGLNPLVDDSQSDPDEDGITNLQEYLQGLNPQVADAPIPIIPLGLGIAGIVVVIILVVLWKRKQ